MAVTLPTVAAVRVIITTSLDDASVTAFITDAAAMVANCIASLDAAVQTTIVKYTTAHLISLSGNGGTDALMTSKRLGDASESYARPSGDGAGLSSTSYGKMAIGFDPNGCLATLGGKSVLMQVL